MDVNDENRNKIRPGVAPCPDVATMTRAAGVLTLSVERGDFDEEFEEVAATAAARLRTVAEMTEEAIEDGSATSSVRAVTLEGLDALVEEMERDDFDEVASVLRGEESLKVLLEWMDEA